MDTLAADLRDEGVSVGIVAIDGMQFHNSQSTVLGMAALGTLPIVQENAQQPVWQNWGAAWRDVYVLDRNGNFFDKINLTSFDPDPAYNGGQNYAQLKSMFVSAYTAGVSPSSDDRAFVAGLYSDLLGRTADAGGLQYFASIVSTARENVLPQTPPVLVGSAEYRNNLVSGYFTKLLGRPATGDDLAFWGQPFQNVGAEQVIASITGSPEYRASHGNSDLGWLQAIYPYLLGRPLDDGGQSYWLARLQSGMAPRDVALGLVTSAEYRGNLVAGYYTQFLNRAAAPGESSYWVGQLAQGQRDEQVAATIASSGEAYVRSGNTIVSWVTGLYQGLLRRAPDAGGLNFFANGVLTAYATTRQAVASAFASTPEYGRRVTADFFSRFLRRPATAADQDTWLALRQQMTDEQEVAGIVASPEYFQRAGAANDHWLDQVYLDLLGRVRDSSSAVFLNALNSGTTTFNQVAMTILGSNEYRTRLVERYYSSLLRRSPATGETGPWVNLLTNGHKDEDVISQMLGTREYYPGT